MSARGRGGGAWPWRGRGRGGGRGVPWGRGRGSSSGSGSAGSKTASSRSTSQVNRTILVTDCSNFPQSLYLPNQDIANDPVTKKKIDTAKDYMKRHHSSFDLSKVDEKKSLQLDIAHLFEDPEFKENWPSFEEDISDKPLHTLGCLGLAAYEVFKFEKKINIRPMNHLPYLSLNNLKVDYFGKLVTIRGTVIRVGSAGLVCTSMAFECTSCHGTQALIQPQGVYTVPTCCTSCRSIGKFEPLQSSPFTITVDSQTAKIQETQSQGTSGTIPRSVEVELKGDLVGSACPGDLLSVTGIVQVRGKVRGGEDGKKAARLMQLYIEAISVHSQRNLNHPSLTFTLNDYYAIQEIHASGDVFKLLVQSLCPSIFGQEMVKAGLILGLMGGTQVEGGSRSNPHVLVVGDPGLGKSQLLQAATVASPRGVYVCGNACTVSGLTVSLCRSEGGGFTLEAGALVLADRGVCCVDELDKLGTTGHGALLEAMEQGSVSVARGGVVCSLAAAPTVLAAANPTHGHYDRSKTVIENLHMSAPLLSRFDLVFILLDRPNEHLDVLLSEHVLALHSGAKPKALVNKSNLTPSQMLSEEKCLSEKLKILPNEEFDALPAELLRKYIAYARKYVHPKLSVEAAHVLQDFFLKLRNAHKHSSYNAITTRQLEACIRLTQARAKVDLKEEATAEHARDVVELMKFSLIDTLCDEFGSIQTSRSIHGSGISARGQVKRFIDLITKRASALGKDTFTKAELSDLHKASNLPGIASNLIEALHVHGYLLLKGPGLYKVLTL